MKKTVTPSLYLIPLYRLSIAASAADIYRVQTDLMSTFATTLRPVWGVLLTHQTSEERVMLQWRKEVRPMYVPHGLSYE